MNTALQGKINETLSKLFTDSKNDSLKMLKGLTKSILRPTQPSDFEQVYLSISKEQGEALVQMIKDNRIRNIVEFGTSFGISTLYLALGALDTGGRIVTTELLESKANQAIENFKQAGVNHLIELRIGDALTTLDNYSDPIDLLFLDGWKNLYLPLFRLLEANFHKHTLVYVDNADMKDVKVFLKQISQTGNYKFELKFHGKAAIIEKI